MQYRLCWVLLLAAWTLPAWGQGLGHYDPAPAWPLCGRIAESPPQGWALGMPCPADRFGDPNFHDAPISSTFGARQLVSGGFRYDFHRGLDLPAPTGTPLFAIADGEVRKAGVVAGFSDPVLELRHFRPGFTSCAAGGGCYASMYLHISAWNVSVGDTVSKGDYIGQSGESFTGFEHLHFEIRDAPPSDPFSSWQKESVHPLGMLPYPDSGADNIQLTLDSVDLTNPMNPRVATTVTIPIGVELDLEALEAEAYRRLPGGGLVAISQPGQTPVGNTVEGGGYDVDPPRYSMNSTNRQYTYKDSTVGIGYDAFQTGGTYESPYAASMPPVYDHGFHMDAADPNDFQVGMFNGMRIAPIHHNAQSPAYQVSFDFLELVGTPNPAELCLRVRAVDALGNPTNWVSHNCPDHSCPQLPRNDCRSADRSVLLFKKRDGIAHKAKWVFKGGPPSTIADFASPESNSDANYSLCLWDSTATTEPLLGIDIPTASLCDDKPCWKPRTNGYKFRDRNGLPHGAIRAKLLAGDVGRSKIVLIAKSVNLSDMTLPLSAPLTTQLIVDDAGSTVCWEAVYPTIRVNDADKLKSKTP